MSRAKRLSELLKKEISSIIITKVNDHRIGFVSIIDIKVTDDLQDARVYFSCLGEESDKKRSLKGLKAAVPFIRGLLAKRLVQRVVPRIRFFYDDSLERGSKTIAILNKLSLEREGSEEKNNQ